MGLFGSRQPKMFELPPDCRDDLRSLILGAPAETAALLRSPECEAVLRQLTERLPADEPVRVIIYCIHMLTRARGYLVLSDRRIVYGLRPDGAAPSLTAVPLTDVSWFTFDSGMATLKYGDPLREVHLGFPIGSNPGSGCERIRAAVRAARPPDQYAL